MMLKHHSQNPNLRHPIMSLHLKSRRNCPPNGFQYHQRETGWQLQTWDFEQLCQELQKHRMANPKFRLSTNMDVIREEVDVANARRVAMMGNTESYLQDFPDATSPPKPMPSRLQRRSVAAVVGRLKSGYDLTREWKESGLPPAPRALAESRAWVCVACPLNGKGGLERYFTIPLARQIQQQIEDFHAMELKTDVDDKLGVCDACLCPLQLKVHTPMALIQKHLAPDVKADLHPTCWILSGDPP